MSDEQIIGHVMRHRNDYYRILMIERTATADQVKVAYKKMALKCHPDKNKHAQAADAFKLVGAANTTLNDATKRRVYDRAGAAGVQRHEAGGGGGGPRARQHGGMQENFFEQFFFGGGRNGPFFQQQQRQHPQHGGAAANEGRPRAGGHPNVQFQEFEINPQLLMLIPVVIFVLLAILLQSGLSDVNTYSGTNSGGMAGTAGAGAGGRGAAPTSASFSLTPSPNDGLVLRRQTTLHGLSVPYYTTRRWAEVMERRRDIALATEQEVLRAQRDYLGNRCESDTFKHRTRGRKDVPEACEEYQKFRRAVG